jgi:hypothetical protein
VLGEEFNPEDGKAYTEFWKTPEEGVDGINFEYYYARKSGDSGQKENVAEEAQKDAGEYLYGYKVEEVVVERETRQVAYELSRENERVYIKTDVKSIEKINPEEFRRIAWEIQTFGKPLPKPLEQMMPEDFIPSKEQLHQQLDALGMIPLPYLGMVVDVLHGSWYWYEEDHVNAAMCAASIGIGVVPF